MDAAIDHWRRQQEDIPNRTAAIRRLVELGLKAPAQAAIDAAIDWAMARSENINAPRSRRRRPSR
jgi:hypothetical protein